MENKFWKSHLLTLGEEGSGGSSGGGAPESSPQPDPGEAPRPNPREAIYAKYDAPADSVPAAGLTPGQPAPKGDPPPSSGTDSEGKPKATGDDVADRRVKDAQAALHASRQELAEQRRKNEELQGKINLVSKYVDWDKLTEWEKQQTIKRLDEPVTVRDLQSLAQELKAEPKNPPTQAPEGASTQRPDVMEFDFNAYLAENDFLVPYAKSGELVGVATTIARENPNLTMPEMGKMVADHFRTREAEMKRRIEQDLTRSREALGSAGVPRASSGMPDSEPTEAPVDNSPAAEVSSRMDRMKRMRTFQ